MRTFAGALTLVLFAAGCSPDGAGGADGADDSVDVETAESAVVSIIEVQNLLYPAMTPPSTCAVGTTSQRVECLIAARYASDPSARDVALSLYRESGGVPGVLPAERYDGGYRGIISLVPALPIAGYRPHLVRVRDAMRDIDDFFAVIGSSANAPLAYRWREVHIQFFRSVGRTTPSAFVEGINWRLAYNVSGSLNTTASSVRETIFHELFHINDWAHSDWSMRVLAPIVSGIIVRCGTSKTCLKPYTPTDVTVSGGTYYAFQPGSPTALEYAAELATRYHDEQLAMIEGRALAKPAFKCGATENATAWKLMADEFFGGVDDVPACAR
jgi:hypothetical protein